MDHEEMLEPFKELLRDIRDLHKGVLVPMQYACRLGGGGGGGWGVESLWAQVVTCCIGRYMDLEG